MERIADKHLILWDGECGLCRRVTQWVAKADVDHLFQTCPYQECPSPPMTPELTAACERAVHVITADGRVLRAGRASMFVLERCGGGFPARLMTLPPFIWFVEIGYWIVAHNRNFFSHFLFTREDPGASP